MLRKLLVFLLFFLVSNLKEDKMVVAITTTSSGSTPAVTMDENLYSGLLLLLPKNYTIINDLYTWNISQIYALLTAADPTLFFNISTALLSGFPEFFLKELPAKVLAYHHLCYLLNSTLQDEYNCHSNSTNASSASACILPFVNSKRYSTFPDGCGLDCKYVSLLYGYTDQTQLRIDVTKCIVCAIGLFTSFIVFWHQYWDSQYIKETFCERPFIAQASFLISVCYTILVVILLLIQIIGKNKVLCQNDLNGNRTVSLNNPRANWMPCTIFGTIFYFFTILVGGYTSAFSIALWHQFYAPLGSIWPQIISYIATLFHCKNNNNNNTINSPTHVVQNSPNEDGESVYSTTYSSATSAVMAKKSTLDFSCCTDSDSYLASIIFTGTFAIHCIVWIIPIGFTIGLLLENIMDAFHPFGLCFAGGNSKVQFRYAVLPFLVLTAISILFIPYALYLIMRTTKNTSSKGTRKTMKELGFRLGAFFFGITFGWIMITFMATKFWDVQNRISNGAYLRFKCVLFDGKSVDRCVNEGYHVKSSIFYLFYFGCLLALLAAFVLSLHSRQVQRWNTLFSKCPCYQRFLKYGCPWCDKNKSSLKKQINQNQQQQQKHQEHQEQQEEEQDNRLQLPNEMSINVSSKNKETELTIKDGSTKDQILSGPAD